MAWLKQLVTRLHPLSPSSAVRQSVAKKRQRMNQQAASSMNNNAPSSPHGLYASLPNNDDIAIDVARTPPPVVGDTSSAEPSMASTTVSSSSSLPLINGHMRPSLHPLPHHSSSSSVSVSASTDDHDDDDVRASTRTAEEAAANGDDDEPTTARRPMGLMETLVERLAQRHNRRVSFHPSSNDSPSNNDEYTTAGVTVNVIQATPRTQPIPAPAHVVTAHHATPAVVVASTPTSAANSASLVMPLSKTLPIERPVVPSTAATVIIDELVAQAAQYASDSPRSITIRGGLTRDEYDLINTSYEDAPRRERDYHVIVSLKLSPALSYIPRALHAIVVSYMAVPPLPAYLQARLNAKEQIAKQLEELETQRERMRSSLGAEQHDADAEMKAKLARRQWAKQVAADAKARYGIETKESGAVVATPTPVVAPAAAVVATAPVSRALSVTTQGSMRGRTPSPARSPTLLAAANAAFIAADIARSRTPSPARSPARALAPLITGGLSTVPPPSSHTPAAVGPMVHGDHNYHHHTHSLSVSGNGLHHSNSNPHLPSLSPPESPSAPVHRRVIPSANHGSLTTPHSNIHTLPTLSPPSSRTNSTGNNFTFDHNNTNNMVGSHAHPLPSLMPSIQTRSSSGSTAAAAVSASSNMTPRPAVAPTPVAVEQKRRGSPSSAASSSSSLPPPQPSSSAIGRVSTATAAGASSRSVTSAAGKRGATSAAPSSSTKPVAVARISPATPLSSLDRPGSAMTNARAERERLARAMAREGFTDMPPSSPPRVYHPRDEAANQAAIEAWVEQQMALEQQMMDELEDDLDHDDGEGENSSHDGSGSYDFHTS